MKVMHLAPVAAAAALGTAALGAAAAHIWNSAPVYAVSTLQTGLEQDPWAWLGRTLLLRGIAVGCSHPAALYTASCPPVGLLDARAAVPFTVIDLQWGAEDPGRALWRRLPLLGRFAPTPQTVHWLVPATYRVRIVRQPAWSCGSSHCDGAMILDSASP